MDQNVFYRRNMAALEKSYPELASRVRKHQIDSQNYRIVRAEKKEPNVLIQTGTGFLLCYDNENPAMYCRDYIDGLGLKNANITVFLGFGLGYHLLVFIRLFADRLETRKIVVFEEDMNLFCLALQLIDLQEIINHQNVHLFVGNDPANALASIRMDILTERESINFMRAAKVIPVPSSIIRSPEYYRKALVVTQRACRQMAMMTGNDPTDSLLGLDNILMNTKNIVSNPGINVLFDRFKGRPAVSVAAGPSLNKNIHLLKEIADKALIVCCDASFLPLMKRGIRPHIVVGFERTEGTEYFYQGISDFDDVYMAVCPLVRPKTFEYFKGKKIIVHRNFSHFHWLHQDKGYLTIGPSVGNMAYKVAEVLGCDPIILIGQDLAFAEDGDTHVKDMPFGERDEFYYKDVLEVEGNSGSPVKTSIPWDAFRVAFEEDIREYRGTCINATEGGAKIRGAEVMPFREAIDKYCSTAFDPVSIIADSLSDFGRDLDISGELRTLLVRTQDTSRAVNQIVKLFKELLDDVQVFQKNNMHPFLYEKGDMDKGTAIALINKFTALLGEYMKDENVNDIMWHTLQPYAFWFGNKFNFLPDLYSDEECLFAAQIGMIKEWLGVVGQLCISTLDSLNKTEAMLRGELEENSRVA